MIAKMLAKRRRMNEKCIQYIDSKFILGSAAEVERLFSNVSNLISQNRNAMSPQFLEALLFFRFNEHMWDEKLTSKAL